MVYGAKADTSVLKVNSTYIATDKYGPAHEISVLRPNKKIVVFWVTGLKILGRVGRHIFFNFFSGKKCNFMHFEFKMHKVYFFSRKL